MSGYIRVWWFLENQSLLLVQIYFSVLCICHVQTKYQSYCHEPVLLCLGAFPALCILQPGAQRTNFRMCCYVEVRWNKKKLGFSKMICKRKTKITKSCMYNIIKIYNLQEDDSSVSVTFGTVSTALSFSAHRGSLNCFSFLKPKFYLWNGLLKKIECPWNINKYQIP